MVETKLKLIIPLSFKEFLENTEKEEGIVIKGCGGDLNEWIDGITKVLNDEGIVKGDYKDIWGAIYLLTTQQEPDKPETGGRHDLVMVFKPQAGFDVGKMAMWRLRVQDISWISDYKVNYASQHNYLGEVK